MRWTERQRAMLREMGVVLAPERPPALTQAVVAPASVASAAVTPAAVSRATTTSAGAKPVAADAAVAERPLKPRPEPATGQWLIVGDAVDAATAGEESALLDNMLRSIGIARSARAGAPVARFMESTAWAAMTADAAGEADPAASCVLVLGRAAAEAVLGSTEPLGTLRGRLHRWQGCPVVVTFSLAYLLRHPADKAKAWADLCLAVQATSA